ncbi:MAG TPA: glutamate--cysteine ligase [Gammaproteobacteria bacterium]
MNLAIEAVLTRLAPPGEGAKLRDSQLGLEKESLRVNQEGSIAQTPHPAEFGSPLTHPWITTDFSEALLELITPPFADPQQTLAFLRDIHQFVYRHLGDEFLWATSMPCVVAGESSIPLARYGSSNAGQMKTVYRRGLGYRYGRVMQTIAGVHFNFSFSDAFWLRLQAVEGDRRPLRDYIDVRYFDLIRNLLRLGWLIPYLFGASPAVCKSFLTDRQVRNLQEYDAFTYYQPYATSLRMGNIGYQNNEENEHGIKACYDSLDEYVKSLSHAINTPCRDYVAIGVKVDGKYRQLNANILQIENEYYSTVRPKQLLEENEKPSLALKRRGVRYIELRSLDVNAFSPLGVDEEQLYFLQALMLYCLLSDSPLITVQERSEIDSNEMNVAHRGREPGLMLMRCGKAIALRDWADEVCAALTPIVQRLDEGLEGTPYAAALQQQRNKIADPDLTPSARMLAEMRAHDESFHAFASRISQSYYRYLTKLPVSDERMQEFEQAARDSLEKQRAIERSDTLSFDDYLARYFAQTL